MPTFDEIFIDAYKESLTITVLTLEECLLPALLISGVTTVRTVPSMFSKSALSAALPWGVLACLCRGCGVILRSTICLIVAKLSFSIAKSSLLVTVRLTSHKISLKSLLISFVCEDEKMHSPSSTSLYSRTKTVIFSLFELFNGSGLL